MIIGNVADGIDSFSDSKSIINQGNVIVGNIIRYTSLFQAVSPALLATPYIGWGAYFILTISLILFRFFVGLAKDSAFELFIETTFFGKKLSYTPRYLKTGSTLQSMQNLHTDIELLLQKDSKLKRKKPHQHIRNFRNQLDELMMMHLFTPTVGEGFVKLYYADAMSSAGSGKKLIEYYPRSIAFSFSADFSLLINQIETIDIRVYLSDEGEPSFKDLRLLSDFQGIEENKIYANARLLDKADKHSFLRGSTADDHLTYAEGKLTYLYTLTDRSFYEKNHPRQLYTYPFFNKGSYYIFVYLRYRLNGKSIMPTRRNNKSSYLVTKFKIEAINHPQQFDYNMILLESKINNLPD